MITPDVLRRYAMALPEVEEFTHFRFRLPLWKVCGKTFTGLESGEMRAVFAVGPDEAAEALPTNLPSTSRSTARTPGAVSWA